MTRSFWAADCETDPFKYGRIPEPFLWGAYEIETDTFVEFQTTKEFVDFFREKNVVVYAHNGGRFDWHYILPFLEEQTDVMVIGGRFAKFKIGRAEFRDSFNLFPIPLKAYRKDEIDMRKLERRVRAKHMDEIRRYNRADCVYLAELLQRFFKDYGRQITLASGALRQWSKISGIKTPETSADFYKRIAPYYYGGRVQCFSKGIVEKNFQVFDINSAYPRAMIDKHPFGDDPEIGCPLPKDREEIARCFITLDCVSTGVFPYREGWKLVFPADHVLRRFHITGWEYLAALETGMLDANARIVKVIRFWQTVEFGDYVRHFFAMKNEADKLGDEAGRLFAKLMLNACYGKFAAAPHEYKEYLTVDPSEVKAHENLLKYKEVNSFANVSLMARPLPETEQRYYNVAVGASITGWVRAYLWRALCAVKSPLYCDTDSIACLEPGALDIGGELGQWKHEGNFTRAAIAGKKLYAFKYSDTDGEKNRIKAEKKAGRKLTPKELEKCLFKTASKGVKLSAKEIELVAKGETIEYKNDAPTFGIRRTDFTVRRVRMT